MRDLERFRAFLITAEVKYQMETFDNTIVIEIQNWDIRTEARREGYAGFYGEWTFDKRTGKLVSISHWQ